MFLPKPENNRRLPGVNRLWWVWLVLWAIALFLFFRSVASLRSRERRGLHIRPSVFASQLQHESQGN